MPHLSPGLLRHNLSRNERRRAVGQEPVGHDGVLRRAVARVAGLLQEEEGEYDDEPLEGDVVPVLHGPGGALHDKARERGARGGADQDGDEVDGEGAAALVQEEGLDDGAGADWARDASASSHTISFDSWGWDVKDCRHGEREEERREEILVVAQLPARLAHSRLHTKLT